MNLSEWADPSQVLPQDGYAGALAGRVWRPGLGPSVVALRDDGVHDVSAAFSTMASLAAEDDPAGALRGAGGERIGELAPILANTPRETRDTRRPHLLAPIDLQVVKAAGVTFATSMLERVIEERARGNPDAAAAIRAEVQRLIGDDLSKLQPGSAAAMSLKDILVQQGAWSQYLEVGIGPDAEVFTKAPVLASVGTLADAGLHPKSTWNNPEPEVVLVVAPDGRITGATLGNDVNLRDFEGRSALLCRRRRTTMRRARSGRSSASSTQLRPRRRAPRHGVAQRPRRGRLRARGLVLDCADQPRSGRYRRPDDRAEPPIPGRVRALSRDHVRADQRPRRAGARLHAPPGDIVEIAAPELGGS
jgi:hypothetical protein